MLRSLISASVRFRFLLIAVAAGVMALDVGPCRAFTPTCSPRPRPSRRGSRPRRRAFLPRGGIPGHGAAGKEPARRRDGVTDVTSDSVPGLSQINLDFTPGTNLYQASAGARAADSAFVLPNVSKPPVLLQPVSSAVLNPSGSRKSVARSPVICRLGVPQPCAREPRTFGHNPA